MLKPEALTTLRIYLTELYQTNQDVPLIIADAGMNLASLNLNLSPMNLWHQVLVEAHKHGKVKTVVDIVTRQYPNWSEKLNHAYDIYLSVDDQAEKDNTTQTNRNDMDFYKFKTQLANILRIPLDAITLLKTTNRSWQIEMPGQAADCLVDLNAANDQALYATGIRSIEVVNRQIAPTSLSAGTSTMKDVHTFRVTLLGKVIQDNANNLTLLVENTSATDYRQVKFNLQTSHHSILLDRTVLHLTDLKTNSNHPFPITIHASQAGSYEIQVRASSIPAPVDGFLRTTLTFIVEPPPAKSILNIEWR